MTSFTSTRPQYADQGLIDHFALPSRLAEGAHVSAVIGRTNEDSQYLSDHHGVIVEFGLWTLCNPMRRSGR